MLAQSPPSDRSGVNRVFKLWAPTAEGAMTAASEPHHRELPLVDPMALQDLAGQLDSPAPALAFARDFALSWQRRFDRLVISTSRSDLTAAMDAALSLKIASTMVGALRLADLARELEKQIQGADLDAARITLEEVGQCGTQTVAMLESEKVIGDW